MNAHVSLSRINYLTAVSQLAANRRPASWRLLRIWWASVRETCCRWACVWPSPLGGRSSPGCTRHRRDRPPNPYNQPLRTTQSFASRSTGERIGPGLLIKTLCFQEACILYAVNFAVQVMWWLRSFKEYTHHFILCGGSLIGLCPHEVTPCMLVD